MYLDRVLYPVHTLGPGQRLVLWLAGCQRHCPGCANPELWDIHDYQKITPGNLAAGIRQSIPHPIESITITGGEPFSQAAELNALLDYFPEHPEVLIFSGYRHEELLLQPDAAALLSRTDVLIDGPYIDEKNDGYSPLRGSSNQRIIYLNPAVRQRYEAYLREGRKIENFIYDYKTLSVGIHNRGK